MPVYDCRDPECEPCKRQFRQLQTSQRNEHVESKVKEAGETYLGDAVFASFDGWQIRLRTDDGNNNQIFLEPDVLEALNQYVDRLRSTAGLTTANGED